MSDLPRKLKPQMKRILGAELCENGSAKRVVLIRGAGGRKLAAIDDSVAHMNPTLTWLYTFQGSNLLSCLLVLSLEKSKIVKLQTKLR